MASASETSYWINFFTSAGIPAGDAAHYAVVFCDNRITREMLLDLSKDYLTDMGVTRLGDVIAILKHAKHVYNQEAKDKILKSSSLTSLSSSNLSSSSAVIAPRRSTAASRMVNQITSKHPEAAPMSQSPVPRPPSPDLPRSKWKLSVFDRLGVDEAADTSLSTPSQSSVFSRLGGRSGTKRAATIILEDLDMIQTVGESLPYAGVLKNLTPSTAKIAKRYSLPETSMTTPVKIKKTFLTDDKKAAQIQRPEVSTTTEGVLSDFAKKETPSLKERLGSKHEVSSSTGSLFKIRPASLTKMRKNKAVTIQERLGTKADDAPVVSSSEQSVTRPKRQKEYKTEATSKQSGVFGRLGLSKNDQ